MKSVSEAILKPLKDKGGSCCQKDKTREDAEQKHLSMTLGLSKGFTLIELLVVVLIIGILSSVALPQYTKAVHRARATEAWNVANTIYNAQEIYKLANNEYETDISNLDIEIPEMKYWEYSSSGTSGNVAFQLQGKDALSDFRLRFVHSNNECSHHKCRYVTCYGKENVCKVLLPCSVTVGSTVGANCTWSK